MQFSISSVSEEKLFLRLSGIQIQNERLFRAIDRIKKQCSINMHKLVGSQIISFERLKKDVDLHIVAGKFISELKS